MAYEVHDVVILNFRFVYYIGLLNMLIEHGKDTVE